MIEDRFVVSDSLWVRLGPQLPGKASDSGVTARNNRLFLEAFSGAFGPVPLGETYRLLSATGIASSVAFADGPSPVFSRQSHE